MPTVNLDPVNYFAITSLDRFINKPDLGLTNDQTKVTTSSIIDLIDPERQRPICWSVENLDPSQRQFFVQSAKEKIEKLLDPEEIDELIILISAAKKAFKESAQEQFLTVSDDHNYNGIPIKTIEFIEFFTRYQSQQSIVSSVPMHEHYFRIDIQDPSRVYKGIKPKELTDVQTHMSSNKYFYLAAIKGYQKLPNHPELLDLGTAIKNTESLLTERVYMRKQQEAESIIREGIEAIIPQESYPEEQSSSEHSLGLYLEKVISENVLDKIELKRKKEFAERLVEATWGIISAARVGKKALAKALQNQLMQDFDIQNHAHKLMLDSYFEFVRKQTRV